MQVLCSQFVCTLLLATLQCVEYEGSVPVAAKYLNPNRLRIARLIRLQDVAKQKMQNAVGLWAFLWLLSILLSALPATFLPVP